MPLAVVSLLLLSFGGMYISLNGALWIDMMSTSGTNPLQDDIILTQSGQHVLSDESLSPMAYDHSRLAALAGREIGFYGYAEDDRIRDLVGYVDYIVIQHALYSGGATIAANVAYLADHGVKVILVVGWWDVWPFPDTGVTSWRELDRQDVLYGMNATETVKYRINGLFANVDPADVWGVCISEEEPGPGPSGYETPWAVPAYYMNYFYDWFKVAYPDLLVFQWPSPTEFLTEQQEHGYFVKADGILYDNYAQDLEFISETARLLKEQYPDEPLIFLTAALNDMGWGTPHPPSYTKAALYAAAEYAEMVGFFCYSDLNMEGWLDPFDQYFLALELCTQTHFHDMNTVYADTQWFKPLHNDSLTERLDNWYRSAWYTLADDTKLQIAMSSESMIGSGSINLTQIEAGVGNYWYQPFSHEKYMGYDMNLNTDDFNLMNARRVSFWIKGTGWSDVTDPSARIVIERQTIFYPEYYGNLTLPDISSWLSDSQWHHLSFILPDDAEYNSWIGTACQIRVMSNYTGSAVSNTTSILLDGFDIQCFDDGVVQNLSSLADYAEAINGAMTLQGSAIYAYNFTTTSPVCFSYSGTGSLEILANGSWYSNIANNTVLLGVGGFRLYQGTWDWIKFDSRPSLMIVTPSDLSELADVVLIELEADDPCGIDHVELLIDEGEFMSFTDYPFLVDWNTSEVIDGTHSIKTIVYSTSGAIAESTISVEVDNTDPVVSITSPEDNDEVAGTVTVMIDVSDNYLLRSLDVFLDGNHQTSLTLPPWEWSWDTTLTANGIHALKVIATDIMYHTSSYQIEVVVSNPTESPSAPMFHQASDLDRDGVFTLAWNMTPHDGQEILNYTIQMADDDNFTSVLDEWVTNNTYLLVSSLDEGKYYFRVLAEDYWGQVSEWSDAIAVTVDLPNSAPSSPSLQPVVVTGNSVQITWTACVDLDGTIQFYEVQYSQDSAIVTGSSSHMVLSTNLTLTSLENGTYYVRVRAYDSEGSFSSWSNIETFSVLSQTSQNQLSQLIEFLSQPVVIGGGIVLILIIVIIAKRRS